MRPNHGTEFIAGLASIHRFRKIFLNLTTFFSPYNEYMKAFPDTSWQPEGDLIPHEVVGMTIKKGYTLIKAWREYLGLTQSEISKRMGITQSAYSQMESGEEKLRFKTIERISRALGINIEQLNP